MTATDKATQLLSLAREIASANPYFHAVRGPGPGDIETRNFMQKLQARAIELFGNDYSEKRICGANSFAVDFYFPDDGTIVEVALGIPNPASEFEKDILKAIMAQDCGHEVHRLYFISRPGAVRKCSQPGRSAVKRWAHEKHSLSVEVHELHGDARARRRKARAHN
jgi:hypothetical protein